MKKSQVIYIISLIVALMVGIWIGALPPRASTSQVSAIASACEAATNKQYDSVRLDFETIASMDSGFIKASIGAAEWARNKGDVQLLLRYGVINDNGVTQEGIRAFYALCGSHLS
jgi:hypothetical protein